MFPRKRRAAEMGLLNSRAGAGFCSAPGGDGARTRRAGFWFPRDGSLGGRSQRRGAPTRLAAVRDIRLRDAQDQRRRLRLTFEDDTVGEVDFTAREWRGVFEPLRDPGYFAQVAVDPKRARSLGRMRDSWAQAAACASAEGLWQPTIAGAS